MKKQTKKEEVAKTENKFTKFDVVEKILSAEDMKKDEAEQVAHAMEFSKSKEFKELNSYMEKMIKITDKLSVELRAKMLELLLSYIMFGVKLPNYLKDAIIQKVMEDKMRKLDANQLQGILGQIEMMTNANAGKGGKAKTNGKEYIG